MLSVNSIVCDDVKREDVVDLKGIFNSIDINDDGEMDKGFCIVTVGCVEGQEDCHLYTLLEYIKDGGGIKAKMLHNQPIKCLPNELKNIFGILRFDSKMIVNEPGEYRISIYRTEKLVEKMSEIVKKGSKISSTKLQVEA